MRADENAFETEIADWLAGCGGYTAGAVDHFDPRLGLDTAELWEFIGATQADDWHRLRMLHGGSADDAQRAFKDRLAKELDARGTVDVLRRGVVDHGVMIRLAYFRPAHGLTPALVDLYNSNRLTVTRQLRYEVASGKTLDLALFVNGLPVATAELKNPITGQGIEEAKAQYRNDRDPANVTLARRAVVHFAVDPELVAMTTRLAGASTEFLPFNRGRDHGAGNPANPGGHRTAYLWQDVWARDNWLDVLQRFVHVESAAEPTGPKSRGRNGRKLSRKLIFPRYHQWDAVCRLEAAARAEGPGHDYLVEHSAGSGKSNTIAWLAHRLATLHDAADNPVFDKVVVITDRNVLDKQLQDTIYQFDHAHGVVQKIDKDSRQLADALAGAAGADNHHHTAEVPGRDAARPRPARPQVRGHRGRGALIPEWGKRHRPQGGHRIRGPRRGRSGRRSGRTARSVAQALAERARARASSRTSASSRSPPPLRAAPSWSSVGATRSPASMSRFTCTRCARRSRKGSSSMSSRTT